MTYDPTTRTVTTGRDNPAELQLDNMIWAVDTMGRLLLDRAKDASDSIKRDGGVIFSWLGQDIGPLTPTSVAKMKLGIFGYVSAVGQLVPMLAGLIPMLDDLKNNFPTFEPPLEVPIPVEVLEAFDRLFADEKIAEKRKQDGFFLRQRMQRTSSKLTTNKSTGTHLLARVHQLSDFTKVFLVVTAAWIFWVWLRTDTEFQLVGYYFRRWHSDMVLPNLLLLPVLLLVGRYVYKLYVRKYRTTGERR